MRKLLLLFLAFAGIAFCQTASNCQFTVVFTTQAAQSPSFNNRSTAASGTPCTSWVVSYYTNSATGVSIQLEGAADSGGAPTGSYTALTAETGSTNPATGTTSGSMVICCDSYPWIRLNPTTLTGAGVHLTARVYGWISTQAAKGAGGGGGAPSGPAGGDLSGTYPNPSVAHLTHVTDSSLANSGLAHPSTTVNGQTCTLGSTCTVTGGPTGAAGGDLSSTYPNPNVSHLTHVTDGSLANSGLTNPATTVNGQTCTLGSTCTVTASVTGGTCSAGQFVNALDTSAVPTCATPSGGGGGGNGVTVYSGLAGVSLSNATLFFPIGGGSLASTTEANVQAVMEASGTVGPGFGVNISTALGVTIAANNTVALTWRKNGSSQTVTCTITNPSLTCADVTHSFTYVAGDVLDVQAVFVGTISAAPVWVLNVPVGGTSGSGATISNPFVTSGGTSAFAVTSTIPPTSPGTWVWVNQASSTVTATTGGALTFVWGGNGSNVINAYVRPIPGATYTLIAGIQTLEGLGNGIACWNSGSGLSFSYFFGLDIKLHAFNYTAGFAFTSRQITDVTQFTNPPILWWKLVEDGVNRTIFVALDGQTFVQVAQVASGTYITPTHCGIGIDQGSIGGAIAMTYSFLFTTP